MALFGRRRGRKGRRRSRAIVRRASQAVRRAGRRVRMAVKGEYRMGILPKAAVAWWVGDAMLDPFIGKGQMSDTVPSGYEVYQKTKDISAAYEAAKRRFFLNVGGYDTHFGKIADWSDTKVLRTWKGAVAPALAIGIDWTLSRFVGRAGRKLKLWKFQLLGSK